MLKALKPNNPPAMYIMCLLTMFGSWLILQAEPPIWLDAIATGLACSAVFYGGWSALLLLPDEDES